MSDANDNAPYAGLSPDVVLDAVESLGLVTDGRLLSLNSFENRVYQIGLEESAPVVAKFYRPGRWSDEAILEEHDFAIRLQKAEIPMVAPLRFAKKTLHYHEDFRFTLFPRQGGREPVLESDDNLAWLGRMIGRIHALGQQVKLAHRPHLMDSQRATEAIETVLSGAFVPPEQQENYRSIASQLKDLIAEQFAARKSVKQIAIHGDCHRGNVLWTDNGPHFVDLDDCLMGPPVHDFWMLLDGEAESRRKQLDILLEAYETFCEFDYTQIGLMEALRALRMIEYAAWIARRWDDPAFAQHFPWYAQPRYWEEHIAGLAEQLHRMQPADASW